MLPFMHLILDAFEPGFEIDTGAAFIFGQRRPGGQQGERREAEQGEETKTGFHE